MKLLTSIFAMTLLLLTACSDEEDNPTNGDGDNQPVTYESEDMAVGDGNAHTWLTVDADGVPTEFGIWIDETALNNLPGDTSSHYHFHLPNVNGDNLIGVQSVHLDWNPMGHPPEGIYNVPHFDLHFYVITDEVREGIPFSQSIEHIDPSYIHDDYIIPDTIVEPGMGVHAVDKTAPELGGEDFTQTYIYGYYDGAMAFFEPMFTVDYLNSNPDNDSFELKVPDAFTYNGYIPQKITYHYDSENGGWNITLSDLVAVTDDRETE